MRLIDLGKFPPGGWQYQNPETKWQVPDPRTFDLDHQVGEVIAHRRANRKYGQPLEPAVVRQEIVEYTCQRLMRDLPANEWKLWISMVDAPGQKKNLKPVPLAAQAKAKSNPRSLLAGLVARIAGVPKGAAIIAEWVGEGCPPVEMDHAERRAAICTGGAAGGQPCPQNVDSTFFDIFTGPIAEAIKRISEIKNKLELRTSHDDKLGVCDVCGCHLKTKVFVPIETIRKHDVRSWLHQPPDFCWMVTEP